MRSKEEIRRWMWEEMERKGIARFPGAKGRIPNFVGAEKAALRLEKLSIWKKARIVKVNPDSPQKEVRFLALSQGKKVIMPTPRIKEGFLLLDPKKIDRSALREASSIRGAFRYGETIPIERMPKVDLIVVGSVCVDRNGNRIGKGGGYAELEYSILKELGCIKESTVVVSTIHDIQMVDFNIPRDDFDLGIDVVVTPSKTIWISNSKKPLGIMWDRLPKEKLEEIPILKELKMKLGHSSYLL